MSALGQAACVTPIFATGQPSPSQSVSYNLPDRHDVAGNGQNAGYCRLRGRRLLGDDAPLSERGSSNRADAIKAAPQPATAITMPIIVATS
jgi:hypothetical protein